MTVKDQYRRGDSLIRMAHMTQKQIQEIRAMPTSVYDKVIAKRYGVQENLIHFLRFRSGFKRSCYTE